MLPAFYAAFGGSLIFLLEWLAPVWLMLVCRVIEFFGMITLCQVGYEAGSLLFEYLPLQRFGGGVTMQSMIDDAKADLGLFCSCERLAGAIAY